MKGRTFTKLICLDLCLVTIFCSGCGWVNCIHEKNKKEFIEAVKKQKPIADSFVPEITDYILETRPLNYFESEEDMRAQGFSRYSDYMPYTEHVKEGFHHMISVLVGDDKDTLVVKFITKILEKDREYTEEIFYTKKSETIGFDFFTTISIHDREDEFRFRIIICYDNKYFTINNSSYDEIGLSDEERTRPTALYMVDLENERLIYCGYSITHFENLYSKGSPIYDAQELCLKISKKEQEIK